MLALKVSYGEPIHIGESEFSAFQTGHKSIRLRLVTPHQSTDCVVSQATGTVITVDRDVTITVSRVTKKEIRVDVDAPRHIGIVRGRVLKRQAIGR